MKLNTWYRTYILLPKKSIDGEWLHPFQYVEKCRYNLDSRFTIDNIYRRIGSTTEYGFAGVQVTGITDEVKATKKPIGLYQG